MRDIEISMNIYLYIYSHINMNFIYNTYRHKNQLYPNSKFILCDILSVENRNGEKLFAPPFLLYLTTTRSIVTSMCGEIWQINKESEREREKADMTTTAKKRSTITTTTAEIEMFNRK